MDRGNENPTQNLPRWLRKTTKKPQSGCPAPGFEPGTSRMRVSCVTTEPLHSVFSLCYSRKLFISSHYLSLTSPYWYLYVTHAARALQSRDLSGEGIKLWITYILFSDHTRTWRASPDEWSAQCRGHLRDSTNMKVIHTNKANIEWWLRRPNDIRGSWGPKVSWLLSYSEEKPRKNLNQETCPDRGSNPGPLRDKRACYHLLHSGGLEHYLFDWFL